VGESFFLEAPLKRMLVDNVIKRTNKSFAGSVDITVVFAEMKTV